MPLDYAHIGSTPEAVDMYFLYSERGLRTKTALKDPWGPDPFARRQSSSPLRRQIEAPHGYDSRNLEVFLEGYPVLKLGDPNSSTVLSKHPENEAETSFDALTPESALEPF
jgi:hypothetical protein